MQPPGPLLPALPRLRRNRQAGRLACLAAAAVVSACAVAPQLRPGSYLAQARGQFLDLASLGRVGFMEATLDGHGCIRPAASTVGVDRALADMLATHVSRRVMLPLPRDAVVAEACVTPAQAIAGQGVDALVAVTEQVGPADLVIRNRFASSSRTITAVNLRAVVAKSSGMLAWQGTITAIASPDQRIDPASLTGPYGYNLSPIRTLALAGLSERLGLEVTELPRLPPPS